MSDVVVIDAAASGPLRREVLRGGRDRPPLGDRAGAHHVGVYDGALLVASGNVGREPTPAEEPGWRVRGMAVDPDHRGAGLGSAVLDALLAHVTAHGGGVVWCQARTPARSLYERAGFVVEGEEWVDPDIGPHLLMVRPVGS